MLEQVPRETAQMLIKKFVIDNTLFFREDQVMLDWLRVLELNVKFENDDTTECESEAVNQSGARPTSNTAPKVEDQTTSAAIEGEIVKSLGLAKGQKGAAEESKVPPGASTPAAKETREVNLSASKKRRKRALLKR